MHLNLCNLCIYYMVLYFDFQLRADIAELKGLVEQAKRERVKSALSIELRRLETKLADLLESEKKSNAELASSATPLKTAAQTSRAYDVFLKNYCKLCT